MDWFSVERVDEKIRTLPEGLAEAFRATKPRRAYELGRDITIVPPHLLPPKPGLAHTEGQARLLHDLASIELQAMELAVRTLYEFPDAPQDFRMQLSEIAEGEGRHLALCLRELRRLGYDWGSWDAHLTLWNAVGAEDTLLDRILIVHRYLEGSGLDAGESILRRLGGVAAPITRKVVQTIVDEEVDHVRFGSEWYRKIAEHHKVDPEKDFASRIGAIARIAPRREKLARELRLRAGFTSTEIQVLEAVAAERV